MNQMLPTSRMPQTMAEQGATQDQVRGYVCEFANGAWVRREELSQHHTWASNVPEEVVESVP